MKCWASLCGAALPMQWIDLLVQTKQCICAAQRITFLVSVVASPWTTDLAAWRIAAPIASNAAAAGHSDIDASRRQFEDLDTDDPLLAALARTLPSAAHNVRSLASRRSRYSVLQRCLPPTCPKRHLSFSSHEHLCSCLGRSVCSCLSAHGGS